MGKQFPWHKGKLIFFFYQCMSWRIDKHFSFSCKKPVGRVAGIIFNYLYQPLGLYISFVLNRT